MVLAPPAGPRLFLLGRRCDSDRIEARYAYDAYPRHPSLAAPAAYAELCLEFPTDKLLSEEPCWSAWLRNTNV
jgi:hypothetical protein